MPKGIKPPATFCGKKGRSGRKSFRDEQLKTRVIQKAWEKKDKRMTDQDATQIVVKDMTNKTEMSGLVKVEQITGTVIKKDDSSIQDANKQTNSSGGVLE